MCLVPAASFLQSRGHTVTETVCTEEERYRDGTRREKRVGDSDREKERGTEHQTD